MVRKPDPAVLVAQTKEPPGKLQTRNVQILDYNINRYVLDFPDSFSRSECDLAYQLRLQRPQRS